jgi:hypothetical protein
MSETIECSSYELSVQTTNLQFFIATTFFLLLLVISDRKEREVFSATTYKPLALSFKYHMLFWAFGLLALSSCLSRIENGSVQWKTLWLYGGHATQILAAVAWNFYWNTHLMLWSFSLTLIAALLACTMTIVLFCISNVPAALCLAVWTAVLSFQAFHTWLFHKLNVDVHINNAEFGHFEEFHQRPNANRWILTQDPNLHVIPANFSLERQHIVDPFQNYNNFK